MKTNAVYSFDVFDTVITRVVYQSTDVFLLVGRDLARLGLTQDAAIWARLRIKAEIDARGKSVWPEVTFADIYLVVAARSGWNEAQSSQAQKIELTWEKKLIRPISKTQDFVKTLIQNGERPIFVSDTYLPKLNVRELLHEGGLTVSEEDLFVSSEHMETKATQGLFRKIQGLVSPAMFALHLGDNYHSDVVAACRSGIPSQHFALSHPNYYERTLYDGRCTELAIRSATAGVTKATRLSRHYESIHAQTLWETGVGVIGPFLVGFVLWVLSDARKRGFERLYFVARDGWIMREIALSLRRWVGDDIELRYLYGSRQAWHPPAYNIDAPPPDWLFENLHVTTFDTFLRRINVSWEEAMPYLGAAGLKQTDKHAVIGRNRRFMLTKLLSMPEFRTLIENAVRNSRETLHAYLTQEGFADDIPFALVDIGWFGRMQGSLSESLKTDPLFASIRLFGYYLGISSRIRPAIGESSASYIPEQSISWISVALHQNRNLAEIVCRASHGTTVGYRYLSTGAVEPILADVHDMNGESRGLHIQQEGALAFAAALAETAQLLELTEQDVAKHLRFSANRNWSRFALRPTLAEADAYGKFHHDIEQGGGAPVRTMETAPALKLRTLLRALIVSPRKIGRFSYWIAGSVRRSGRLMQLLFFLYALKHVCLHTVRSAGLTPKVLRRG